MKINLLYQLLFPACIGLLTNLSVKAQSNISYGVTAMTLGQRVKKAPTVSTPPDDWGTSPVLNQFYKAGGEQGTVTPMQARIVWTDDTLYVMFHCQEPNMDHPGHVRKFRLADYIDNSFLLDTYFQDRVDVFIRPEMNSGHFYQFSIAKDGQSAGAIRGQLSQVKNPEGGGEVTKDRNSHTYHSL